MNIGKFKKIQSVLSSLEDSTDVSYKFSSVACEVKQRNHQNPNDVLVEYTENFPELSGDILIENSKTQLILNHWGKQTAERFLPSEDGYSFIIESVPKSLLKLILDQLWEYTGLKLSDDSLQQVVIPSGFKLLEAKHEFVNLPARAVYDSIAKKWLLCVDSSVDSTPVST